MIALLNAVGQAAGLPAGLLAALCTIESGGNPSALAIDDGGRSSIGLCQVQLRTARTVRPKVYASDLFKPEVNAVLAAAYLKRHLTRTRSLGRALCRYNGAKGSDCNYSRKVLSLWKAQQSPTAHSLTSRSSGNKRSKSKAAATIH